MPRDFPKAKGSLLMPAKICGLVLWLVSAPAMAAVADGPCSAWPGEPTPLPTLTDPDAARARWAELRARDLRRRAAALEPHQPVEAYRLWRHAVCLEPGGEEARRALARTHPIRVHRPPVVRSPGGASAAVPADPDPWALLAAPVPIGERREVDLAARAGARKILLARIDARLVAGEEQLRQARFHEALAVGAEVRGRLDRMRPGRDVDEARVRLEVLAATAQLALADEGAARECLARAIAIRPELNLDTRRTPPKLLRALEAARAAAEVTP